MGRRVLRGAVLALVLAVRPAWGAAEAADADPAAIQDLYQHSLEVARRSLQVSPGNSKASFDAARVHRRFGYDDRAIEAFRECLRKEGKHPEVLSELGFILSQRFQDQALVEYRSALALDARHPGVRTRIALILAHQGKHAEALSELEGEARNGTASALTHHLRGQALLDLRRPAEAVPALEESLRLDPGDRKAWYALAQAQQALARKEEARRARAEFVRLKAEEDRHARDVQGSNRHEQLRWAAETCVDVAETFRQLKVRPQVLRHLLQALRFDAENLEARKSALEMLREERRLDEAIALCRETPAAVRSPELIYIMAGLHTEKGSFDQAAAALEEVLRLSPEDGDALRELAKLKLGRKVPGSPEEGIHLAQRAVRSAPRNGSNRFVLGMAFLTVKDLPGAVRELEEAVRLDPGNAAYRRRLEELKAGKP